MSGGRLSRAKAFSSEVDFGFAIKKTRQIMNLEPVRFYRNGRALVAIDFNRLPQRGAAMKLGPASSLAGRCSRCDLRRPVRTLAGTYPIP